MIRPRRRCPKCGGKVKVLRVIRKRKGRTKGATSDKREGRRCLEPGCGEISVAPAPKTTVDKR